MELSKRKHLPVPSSAALANTSSKCGTCWSATYQGKTIHILAVDHSAAGLNIALTAMDELTNGQAEALGRVDAEVSQVPASECGL